MDSNNSIHVETVSWPQIQVAINNGMACVIPVGAACKEHGPHLPLNTDFVQASWLSKQVALRFPLLVWPVISFGYYPSFVDYPGSWSISEKTFIQCVLDIIESIAKHSDNQLILLNTGISTIRPIEAAITQSPYQHRTTLINVYSGKHFTAVVEDIEEQIQGGHADEIETSIMLAIDKSLVDMKSAKPGLEDIKKGPLNLFDPEKHNYCPTGAMGNPTLASVEKGEKFVNAILTDLNDRIGSIINVK
jgi:creatinine amidohydrolase